MGLTPSDLPGELGGRAGRERRRGELGGREGEGEG